MMDDLAQQIADKVISDTKYFSAAIGFLGVIVGSLFTVFGNAFMHWWKEKPARDLDAKRKELLKTMLTDARFKGGWRKLATLSRVIGADEATTTRLLIELKARGSENDDGLWGLIESHPIEKIGQ
ncbi:MAG: hypothetical protein WAV95_08310 [Azonexus sp.]